MNNNRLKDLRNFYGYTQKELVDKLQIGIAEKTYGHYERGRSDIPTDVLIALAYLYNTSIDYILGITSLNKPYPRSKSVKICDSIIPLKKSLK